MTHFLQSRLFSDACKSQQLNSDGEFPTKCAHRYAYFHDLPQADLPYIKIPLHTVIKLTPKAYGCDEERYVTFMLFYRYITIIIVQTIF